MQLEQLISQMTPTLYERLRTAVETGKWFDGNRLDDNQREICLQAVMIYQAKVEKSNQHMTIGDNGEIVHKTRQDFKNELKLEQEAMIARFKQS
ncbi:YeaC family protein [Alteromonas oceanisediminis]|uniref:YeaC family protein n=1 Tax=Alteromonas oceanisediminis TaxID=2836180 RepID=UPI001BDACAC9|nr:DUF1315 family protein [Alteromonas oceanisediminis]MBT0586544.1 DUF1315 family protein [Alteromonas oceanisediminis]